LSAFLAEFRQTIVPGENPVLLLVRLNQLLQRQIRYLVRMEPGVQPPDVTLENCSGSCRDTGWLLVQIMRHLGIAARFASGYLIQLVADVKALDGPSGTERDFTDLHAWAEAFIPGAGWIGLDPTSGLLAGEGHIPLACTADPGNAAPVIGYTDVSKVEFEFAMSVTRVHEDPRVTRPYSDAQWNAIDALGEQVDRDLAAHDVRLTQGGEPTFVSIDDMEGPEWNYEALSPKKRELGERLVRRLRSSFAPNAFCISGRASGYPRRAAAPLGARHFLAHRRPAAVASGRTHRRHVQRRRCDGSHGPGVRRAACRRASPAIVAAHYRLRGRAETAAGGSDAAAQCRSAAGRPCAAGRAGAARAFVERLGSAHRPASCCR
jgi:hypothetical protein